MIKTILSIAIHFSVPAASLASTSCTTTCYGSGTYQTCSTYCYWFIDPLMWVFFILLFQMAFKPYKVHIIGKGCASDTVIIGATNVTQAREFAKARFPDCKIGSIKL